MAKIKKMISFDRKNYYSVITAQGGVPCCSNEFAESLCKELNKSGLKLNLDQLVFLLTQLISQI